MVLYFCNCCRFKLVLCVTDHTGEAARFILFDNVVVPFLHNTAMDLAEEVAEVCLFINLILIDYLFCVCLFDCFFVILSFVGKRICSTFIISQTYW